MRIKIESQSFSYLEVYKCNYLFEKNNSGPVRCRDCRSPIGPELGIFRQAYKRSGFLCFSCFALDLSVLTRTCFQTDAGFFVDSLGRLRACTLCSPSYSTPEVIQYVYQALLDRSYTSIDILLGSESAHPWKILDAAEAAVGTI